MIIDNIKNYLSETKKEEFIKIINEIYTMTKHLNNTYPDYKKWFFYKQVKECSNPNRNIIFIKSKTGKIIGISFLKKDNEEKKICTLFINPNYRMLGIANLILEESMKFLETSKPLATFTEDKLDMFTKIIEKYDWKLTEIVDGIYNKGVREFCFNGQLSKRDYRQELIEILRNLKIVMNEKLEPTDNLDKYQLKDKKTQYDFLSF